MNCMHVKVKATPAELQDMGIDCPKVLSLIEKGCAFEVDKRSNGPNGRMKVHLTLPGNQESSCWVWEDMTQRIQ